MYLITGRQLLPQATTSQDLSFLIDFANRAAAAGVDMVQIRERDLPARDLFSLTEAIAKSATATPVLVNDRADVAACTEAGVHLTTRSLTADVVRSSFGHQMLVGVSTHTLEEAEAAERDGADFVVFGPVFDTASKKEYGDPLGVAALRRVADCLRIPTLALGGIKLSNYQEALDAGAAGVAGISMFTEAEDLNKLVSTIKNRGVA